MTSPIHPDWIEVAGQRHRRTLLYVMDRDGHGFPVTVQVLSIEAALALPGNADTIFAYLPHKEAPDAKGS